MIIISRKLFSKPQITPQSPTDILEREVEEARKRNRGRDNTDNTKLGEISSDLDKLNDLEKDIKKYRKRHKGHEREYNALLGKINSEQHNLKYQERREQRALDRAEELYDIQRQREIEDAAGTGNQFKRRIEDAKLNTKYKLQDVSDSYFKDTGRSLKTDAALGTAALAGGYLAYKSLKKARIPYVIVAHTTALYG